MSRKRPACAGEPHADRQLTGRKVYSTEFKTKLVLEVSKNDKTSNTMDAAFVIGALNKALLHYISNTGGTYTGLLSDNGITISMDDSMATDNIAIERFLEPMDVYHDSLQTNIKKMKETD